MAANGCISAAEIHAETLKWMERTGLVKRPKELRAPLRARVLRCVAGWLLDLSCWLMIVAARGKGR
jgi:hypothetical protein